MTEMIEKTPLTPSVGRVVHATYTGRCYAAIITATTRLDEVVSLTVFYPNGVSTAIEESQYASGRRDGTWHWPERV